MPHPPALLTLLTSAFLHGGLAHLLGNMLFLWIFGANVEDSFDWPIYLAFVVICAISANLAEVAMDAHSLTPRIGASGFISGIMGSYLILFPKAKLKYIVFLPVAGFQTFKMPAWLALTFWIGTQVYSLRHAAPEAAGGVAFLSHIAGFGMGACLGWLLWYFGIAATYAEGMTEPD
ncbi:MAG TPA: rhomboid family intramembrane serine protease [Patescibacteria group bacterium]|nr:rhomboid family intramembrane serine protease [Patescibacteria group bacterium]